MKWACLNCGKREVTVSDVLYSIITVTIVAFTIYYLIVALWGNV